MPGLAAPEAADVVAVPAVPVRPARAAGEAADLVQAGGVPRLGDQLGVGQQAVLGDHLDHRRLDQHVAAAVAAQDRGQVEAEAVDVHSATKLRRQDRSRLRTTGWLQLTVLPQPVKFR